jgi:D-amino-acid dehydrogenase
MGVASLSATRLTYRYWTTTLGPDWQDLQIQFQLPISPLRSGNAWPVGEWQAKRPLLPRAWRCYGGKRGDRSGNSVRDRSVVVVGAGITGLSAAEWLRRGGCNVLLIDAVFPGDRAQASFGNAGLLARTSILPVATPSLVRKAPGMALDKDAPLFLRWSYLPWLLPWLVPFLRNANARMIHAVSAHLAALVLDANEQHLALAAGTGAEAFIARGDLINLYPQRAQFEADALSNEIRRQHGIVPALLTRDALVERDPRLGPAYAFGAVFAPYWWLTSPGAYLAALFAHYRRQGGRFRQARVVRLAPGPTPVVTLDGGEDLTTDKVILSAGAWSASLARSMGLRVTMEAERGYHVAFHAPSHTAPQPYMVTDAKLVVTPMDGGLRAAGLVEFAGIDAPASAAPIRLIERGMTRLYPDLDYDRTESWMGRRPTTPDSLPVIGESARTPNVLHAYGGQHVGLTIGPKLGRIAAGLVSGAHSNLDLSPYDPDRF